MFKVDDEYSYLTETLLREEYLNNNLSDNQIAKKYGIGSKATVWRRRKYYGIDNKKPNKSNKNASVNRKINISEEDAIKWQSSGKTQDEIAKIIGCSRIVVHRRLKELGLTNKCHQAIHKLRWHVSLSNEQKLFLLGDLLGDGSISSDGMYQCSHSHKQKGFIERKQNVLSNLLSPNYCIDKVSIHNDEYKKTYQAYHLRTMVVSDLKNLRKIFYKNNEKIFPLKFLNESDFNEISLAVWYMGDGSRSSYVPSLYTYGFGYQGNLEIMQFLNQKFNIKANLRCDNGSHRHPDHRHYLSIQKGDDSQRFFSLVAPHILPCLQYKLPQALQLAV
jgi:transposase